MGTESFFEMIGSRAEAALRRTATPRRYRRGDTLFHEGDHNEQLHLIASGSVAVSMSDLTGASVIVNVLGRSELLGELSVLLDDSLRTATAVALEDTTTLTITGAQLDSLRTSYPSIDRALVTILATKLRDTSSRVLESSRLDARQRVLRRLAALVAANDHGEGPAVVPITQETLANMAGADRRKANEVLGELERGEIVERGHRGRIVVTDVAGLYELLPAEARPA
ncbi:MAG: Crp/Fnr family transcriptional regulator [Actinomycetota bacterium]